MNDFNFYHEVLNHFINLMLVYQSLRLGVLTLTNAAKCFIRSFILKRFYFVSYV